MNTAAFKVAAIARDQAVANLERATSPALYETADAAYEEAQAGFERVMSDLNLTQVQSDALLRRLGCRVYDPDSDDVS